MSNNKQKLELTWIGKNNPEYDIANIEPRILEERTDLSYGDKDTENMIIHGDNLLALKALLPEYEGKVKCIYIDPPYNTGNAFDDYDDGVEHSTWLSLLKPRLELLKVLLKDEGVIFVQIGFDEMAYLKVLMDEVFTRSNCLGQVAVRMSHSAGMKRKAADKRMIKNTEYLLVYFNNIAPVLKPVFEETIEYPVNYYQFIVRFPTVDTKGEYGRLIDVIYPLFKAEFDKFNLAKSNKSIATLFSIDESFRNWIYKNSLSICRTDSNIPTVEKYTDDLTRLRENELKLVKSEAGDYWIGKNTANNYYQVYSIIDKLKEVNEIDDEGNVIKRKAFTNLLGDWWDGFWRDMSRVDVEGGVKMKESKKPERIVSRVFEICTNKGDLVLDSFLGSGTTSAVAHKMERKYIGIEMGEHAYSLAQKRMTMVVDGSDQNGITKAVEWKGGGGFKFYELAPSFVVIDEFGNPVIDSYYNDTKLIRAMCKLTNYTFSPSGAEYWKHGKGQGNNSIYVTTQMLSVAMVQQIVSHLGANETLLICPKKFEPGCEKVDARITIKKIPQSILKACQFGKKEYLLPIKERAMEEVDEDEVDSDKN